MLSCNCELSNLSPWLKYVLRLMHNFKNCKTMSNGDTMPSISKIPWLEIDPEADPMNHQRHPHLSCC